MFPKLFLLLCFLLVDSNAKSVVPSPQPPMDIICHTNKASECYPRLFQPTDDFQVVREDQDLPPGLHIRLNLGTGVKEAKINVIDEGDKASSDVILVDTGGSIDRSVSETHYVPHAQQILNNVDHGPILPPAPSSDGAGFYSQKNVVNTVSATETDILLPALEGLEDVSHDIYWGLELVKDTDTVHKLVCLLRSNLTDPNVRSAAALVLGTALQNNPSALALVLAYFHDEDNPTGPLGAVITVLTHERLPHLLSRCIYLLSSLCLDQTEFLKFVELDGLGILRDMFDARNAGNDLKDRVRGKIANFITDRLLQPDSPILLPKTSSETPEESIHLSPIVPTPEVEESWIVEKTNAAIERDMKPKEKEMEESGVLLLKPWRDAFFTALRSWEASQTVSDQENYAYVQDAYHAIEQKLLGASSDKFHLFG